MKVLRARENVLRRRPKRTNIHQLPTQQPTRPGRVTGSSHPASNGDRHTLHALKCSEMSARAGNPRQH